MPTSYSRRSPPTRCGRRNEGGFSQGKEATPILTRDNWHHNRGRNRQRDHYRHDRRYRPGRYPPPPSPVVHTPLGGHHLCFSQYASARRATQGRSARIGQGTKKGAPVMAKPVHESCVVHSPSFVNVGGDCSSIDGLPASFVSTIGRGRLGSTQMSRSMSVKRSLFVSASA